MSVALLRPVLRKNGSTCKKRTEYKNLSHWHDSCPGMIGISKTLQSANERGDGKMRRTSAVLLMIILGCAGLRAAASGNNLETVESIQPHVLHLKLKLEELKVLTEKQVLTRGLS